jgi:archaellum component FlaF (FlaF/FlaG flagellin family)
MLSNMTGCVKTDIENNGQVVVSRLQNEKVVISFYEQHSENTFVIVVLIEEGKKEEIVERNKVDNELVMKTLLKLLLNSSFVTITVPGSIAFPKEISVNKFLS